MSFFLEYGFSKRVSNLSGYFTGNKIYSVQYAEEVERLVNDALRILKEESESVVTFQCFTGYETIDLLRLFRSSFYDGSEMTEVFWTRNDLGYTVETHKAENIAINKRNVRKAVYKAIADFQKISD